MGNISRQERNSSPIRTSLQHPICPGNEHSYRQEEMMKWIIAFIILGAQSLWAQLFSMVPAAYDLSISPVKINKELLATFCVEYSQKYIEDPSFSFNCNSSDRSVDFESFVDKSVWISFENYQDSVFTVNMERTTQNCSETYPNDTTYGTPGTHQFSEVLKLETLRLQDLGILEDKKDSLEELLDTLIAEMKNSKLKCSEDIDWAYVGIGPGCCSLVESPSAISLHSFVRNHLHSTKISHGKFRIDGADLGTPYRLFDLNGKLLRSGVLQSREVTTPSSPAILDIAGKRLLLQ